MARKRYSVILALGLVLGIIGIASSIAQAWLPLCEMSCNEHIATWNELRESHVYCEGVAQSPRCIFKKCCPESPALAVSVVLKAENRQYADSAIHASQVIPITDFVLINNDMVEALVPGPPVPLFLKNLSLLC